MIVLPETVEKEVPTKLKTHNGILHGLALSDDPAIKCQNVMKLAQNIKTTIVLAGLGNFEIYDEKFKFKTTLERYLEYQILGANKAWGEYNAGKAGYAVQKADAVVGALLFIIYDERFVLQDKNSFTGRSDK